MRKLLFGDLHAHNWPQCSGIGIDGLNTRLLDTAQVLREIFETAIRFKAEEVIDLGDTFHSRDALPIEVYQVIHDIYEEFGEKLNITVIVGNHNISKRTPKYNSVANFKNVRTISVPTVDGDYGYIPYMTNQQELLRAIKMTRNCKHVYLHQGVQGVESRSGYVLSGEPLRKADIRKGPRYFSGHIHEHQKVKSNFVYVGSPLQHDWGDAGITKGFVIVKDNKWKFVETKTPPKFVNIRLGTKPDVKGNFVRVIAGSEKELEIARSLEPKLARAGARFVAPPVPSFTSVVTGVSTMSGEALSLKRLVDAYVTSTVKGKKKRQILRAIARELISEVQ